MTSAPSYAFLLLTVSLPLFANCLLPNCHTSTSITAIPRQFTGLGSASNRWRIVRPRRYTDCGCTSDESGMALSTSVQRYLLSQHRRSDVFCRDSVGFRSSRNKTPWGRRQVIEGRVRSIPVKTRVRCILEGSLRRTVMWYVTCEVLSASFRRP